MIAFPGSGGEAMGRKVLYCGVAGLSCVMLLATQVASAQVRSASRHAVEEQAQAERGQEQRIMERYDARELEAMMELGNGSLRGVMGYSIKPGRSLARMLSRAATAVADREWVFLLPMTAHVEAWHDAYGLSFSSHHLRKLHPDIWKYAGRVRTDREGNFEFAGLKPGRYLVWAEFPVTFETERHVDTGRRSVSYSPAFGSGSIDPVYRREFGTQSGTVTPGQLVTVREGAATTFRPLVE
ncbi:MULTISPECIES: hypothetical protein [unclassified Luteimonas]